METIDVSIIVCTWNRARLLERTLADLTNLAVPEGLTFEIIVVDNNSTDSTAQVVAGASTSAAIRYVHEAEQGLSQARNRGLRESCGRLLLFTDDDVLVPRTWLTDFVAAAQRHPSAGAFGGPVHPWFESPPDRDVWEAFPALRIGLCGIDYGPIEHVLPAGHYLVGANFAIRRSAAANRMFDTRLGTSGHIPAGAEEVTYQDNLRRDGWELLWVPAISVQHWVPPERMTVSYLRSFTFHRHRSSALAVPLPGSPRWLGVPRWLWWHTASRALRVLGSALRANRAARLEALYNYDRARGLLIGTLAIHRQQPNITVEQGDQEQ